MTSRLIPLSLYVHLPWCLRKCPYCDFNSHAVRGEIPESSYVDALLADLDQDLALAGDRPLISIFIGGGTPSLFSPPALERLLRGIGERIAWTPEIEITLEANPGTVESDRFAAFRALGINRLSLGVQSFQDDKLKRLGRIHDGGEAIRAVEIARRAGFSNLNLDLMFGLPGQSVADALVDLETALALHPDHLSWYQLTLEPNTLFAKYPPPLPEDEQLWEIQCAGLEKLAEAGFERYEISAHARNGKRCRHNLNYWRFGDYLGIGAGAHGKITDPSDETILRYWKIRHPEHYIEKASTDARLGGWQPVGETEKPLEFLMNTLRLREGFTPARFESRTGMDYRTIAARIEDLIAEGWLVREGGAVRCSERGWNFLDSILGRFA